MNNKFTRALSSVLAFIMLCSCICVMNVGSVAFAAGESVTWSMTDYTQWAENGTTLANTAIGGKTVTSTVGGYTLEYYAGSSDTLNEKGYATDKGLKMNGAGKFTSRYFVVKNVPANATVAVGVQANGSSNSSSMQYKWGADGTVTTDSAVTNTTTTTVVNVKNTNAAASDLHFTFAKKQTVISVAMTLDGGSIVDPNPGEETTEATTEAPTETTTTAPVAGAYTHNFSTDGTTSEFYTISGRTTSANKTYNGLTFTTALKLERSTAVEFDGTKAGTLTLVLDGSQANKVIEVDGVAYNADSNGVVTVELEAKTDGTAHKIAKGSKGTTNTNICYISFSTTGGSIVVPPTPTVKDVTVTVYDSVTREKVSSVVYYWTTLAADQSTKEYKINSGAVINVTAIADGKATPDSEQATAAADMTAAKTAGKLYVSATGYDSEEVTLPAEGNINVLLTPLAEVNIAQAGIYEVNPDSIVGALLTSDATHSYMNPYITNAEVNGFRLNATSDKPIKVMQKVNTRNQAQTTPYIQLLNGATIKYTPSVNGKLTVNASATNRTDTRTYAFTDSADVSLTGQTMTANTFALTAGKEYTLTVNSDGINLGGIAFVPDEITKYTVTFTNDATNGTASATVGGAAVVSGTAYDENSEISITASANAGKKAVVKVNGNIVTLVNDVYSFQLRQDTIIDVSYENEDVVVTDQLKAMMIGDLVNLNNATDLVRQNTAYAGSYKVKYFADAVTGGGKTHVIKLKNNDAANFVEVMAGEDGNMVVNFNSNNLVVKGSDGSTFNLSRSTDKASADVSRSFEAKAGVRYTITATGGNSYVNFVQLLAATIKTGDNIASVNTTEIITNADILAAYGADAADKNVRIVGQLKDITEATAANVEGAGITVIDCTVDAWKASGCDESHVLGSIEIGTVYGDVYNSAGYDAAKVNGDTYLGATLGLSQLNAYFDVLVSGAESEFEGKAAVAYTVVNGAKDYYDNNAELSGINF